MTIRDYIYSGLFLLAGLWIGHWWGWLRACRFRDCLDKKYATKR